ncbi:MAG TPA: hypothetical protein VID95_07185, partial [Candidatus Limnocylindrales bacterium]
EPSTPSGVTSGQPAEPNAPIPRDASSGPLVWSLIAVGLLLLGVVGASIEFARRRRRRPYRGAHPNRHP